MAKGGMEGSYGGKGGQAFSGRGRAGKKNSGSSSSSSSSRIVPTRETSRSYNHGVEVTGKQTSSSSRSTWTTPAGGKSALPQQTSSKSTAVTTGTDKAAIVRGASLSGSSNYGSSSGRSVTVTQSFGDNRGQSNTYTASIGGKDFTIAMAGTTPEEHEKYVAKHANVRQLYERTSHVDDVQPYLKGITKYQQSLTPSEKAILAQTENGGLYLNTGSTKGYYDKTGLVNPATIPSKTFTENTVNNAAASKALVGASGATPTLAIITNNPETQKANPQDSSEDDGFLGIFGGIGASIGKVADALNPFNMAKTAKKLAQENSSVDGYFSALGETIGDVVSPALDTGLSINPMTRTMYLTQKVANQAPVVKDVRNEVSSSIEGAITSAKEWAEEGAANVIRDPSNATASDYGKFVASSLIPFDFALSVSKASTGRANEITADEGIGTIFDAATLIPAGGVLAKGTGTAAKAGKTVAKNAAEEVVEMTVKNSAKTGEKIAGNITEDIVKTGEKNLVKKSNWKTTLGTGLKTTGAYVGTTVGATVGLGVLGSLIANDGSNDFSGQQTNPNNDNQRGNTFNGDVPSTSTDALLLPYQPTDGGDILSHYGYNGGGSINGGSDQSGGEYSYNDGYGGGGKYEIYNQEAPDYSALANALKIVGVLALVGIVIMAFSKPSSRKGAKS